MGRGGDILLNFRLQGKAAFYRGRLDRDGGGLFQIIIFFHETHINFPNFPITPIAKTGKKLVMYHHFANAMSFIP